MILNYEPQLHWECPAASCAPENTQACTHTCTLSHKWIYRKLCLKCRISEEDTWLATMLNTRSNCQPIHASLPTKQKSDSLLVSGGRDTRTLSYANVHAAHTLSGTLSCANVHAIASPPRFTINCYKFFQMCQSKSEPWEQECLLNPTITFLFARSTSLTRSISKPFALNKNI